MSGAALELLGRVSLSAGVMILAAVILRLRFGGGTPGRVFCLLWDIILFRLLLPADIPSPVSVRRLLGDSRRVAAAVVTQASGGALAGETYAVQEKLPALDWAGALTLLWAAGMVLGLAWLAAGHLRSRRIYAAALPSEDGPVRAWQAAHPLRRTVRVRVSDRIASPLTYGVLHPVVLLPRGMDRDLIPCVLAHEYAHIRRFDALRKPLLALALCVHWFNPLVWVMYVLAGRDMELACDEAAVRAGADRRGYALALLSMEEERGRRPLSGSHFSANALEERIKGIMGGKRTTLAALLAVLTVMSAATTVFAAGAPAERAPASAAAVTRIVEREALLTDGNGQTYLSPDGGQTWMTEDRYHAQYDSGWDVEWWTCEEYKAWLDREREQLQGLIGERACTGSEGWFVWDQKRVDETVALYEQILEDMQNGGLYSREIRDSDGRPVPDAVLSSGGMAAGSPDGKTEGAAAAAAGYRSRAGGRSLQEIFAPYESWGLTYTPGEGGNLAYNGQPVSAFLDQKPGGGVFSYEDPYVEEGLRVSVLYDGDGAPAGLTAAQDAGEDG